MHGSEEMGYKCNERNQVAKKMCHLLKAKAVTERALTETAFVPKPVVAQVSGEPEKGLSNVFITHFSSW